MWGSIDSVSFNSNVDTNLKMKIISTNFNQFRAKWVGKIVILTLGPFDSAVINLNFDLIFKANIFSDLSNCLDAWIDFHFHSSQTFPSRKLEVITWGPNQFNSSQQFTNHQFQLKSKLRKKERERERGRCHEWRNVAKSGRMKPVK